MTAGTQQRPPSIADGADEVPESQSAAASAKGNVATLQPSIEERQRTLRSVASALNGDLRYSSHTRATDEVHQQAKEGEFDMDHTQRTHQA